MAQVRLYRILIREKTMAATTKKLMAVLDTIKDDAARQLTGGPYSTGRLARSLKIEGPRYLSATRVTGRVGSDLYYARLVHNGAEIHDIFPRGYVGFWRPGDRHRPQLKFFWRKAGRTAFFPHIPGGEATIGSSHPGQPGKQYLAKAAFYAAGKHRVKVVLFNP